MRIVVSHNLSQEEALSRIKSFLGELKEKYGGEINNLHEEWSGNSAKFRISLRGFTISGVLKVGSSQVELSGTLPFAAKFFKGKIEKIIRAQATEFLS